MFFPHATSKSSRVGINTVLLKLFRGLDSQKQGGICVTYEEKAVSVHKAATRLQGVVVRFHPKVGPARSFVLSAADSAKTREQDCKSRHLLRWLYQAGNKLQQFLWLVCSQGFLMRRQRLLGQLLVVSYSYHVSTLLPTGISSTAHTARLRSQYMFCSRSTFGCIAQSQVKPTLVRSFDHELDPDCHPEDSLTQ